MSEWQDISTAPKDGSWVLVHNSNYDRPYIARYEEHPGPYSKPQWVNCLHEESDFDYFGPTHWMPLPTPPQAEGTAG